MPRVIPTDEQPPIELGDLVERLETGSFDADDEECFASWGQALRQLAGNRRFLADFVIEELKRRCAGQVRRNVYGAQVVLLDGQSRKFIIRANFWPAGGDSIARRSGMDVFFYGLPHDHNFSFLTVGYLGTGYWSDYYEYDHEDVVGLPGEKLDLRFVERSRLEEGKVMLYRAHRDVHLQLPADEMSVSLNILGLSPRQAFRDQYRFDVERREIVGVLNNSSIEPLIAIAALYGGDNGRDLVNHFAVRHPSDRIRFAAVRAQAAAAGGVEARLAAYERVAADPNLFVSGWAKFEMKRLESSRGWIERDLRKIGVPEDPPETSSIT
jgi:hypothetical protein